MKYTCKQFPLVETFECDTEDELIDEIEIIAENWDRQDGAVMVIDENGVGHHFELAISVSAHRVTSKTE